MSEILYFLLHYIYLQIWVRLQMKMFAYKTFVIFKLLNSLYKYIKQLIKHLFTTI